MSTNTINQIEVNDVLYDLEDSIARNKVWEGTKEEFNAQKDSIPDGTTILLSNDLPTGETGADQISYDNTESELEAVDVQEAIDEVLSKFGECKFSCDSNGAYVTYMKDGVEVTKKLGSIEGSAVASQVLDGATFGSSASDELQTGTMPNNGAVSQTLAANGTYTIPEGYHNGSGKVTQSLTTQAAKTYSLSTSDQTIAAGTYLSGAATIKGVSGGALTLSDTTTGTDCTNYSSVKTSGLMKTPTATLTLSNTTTGTDCTNYKTVATSGLVKPTATKAATTHRASTSAQTIAAGTYCSGAQTIAAVSQTNLAAANIKSGVTISVSNGSSNIWSVAGTYTGAYKSVAALGYPWYTGGPKAVSFVFDESKGLQYSKDLSTTAVTGTYIKVVGQSFYAVTAGSFRVVAKNITSGASLYNTTVTRSAGQLIASFNTDDYCCGFVCAL